MENEVFFILCHVKGTLPRCYGVFCVLKAHDFHHFSSLSPSLICTSSLSLSHSSLPLLPLSHLFFSPVSLCLSLLWSLCVVHLLLCVVGCLVVCCVLLVVVVVGAVVVGCGGCGCCGCGGCGSDVELDAHPGRYNVSRCTQFGWQNTWESDSRRPRHPGPQRPDGWRAEKCNKTAANYPHRRHQSRPNKECQAQLCVPVSVAKGNVHKLRR